MKIGIVTFWQSNDNYGQLLQCWALQEYLRKLGHEPYLIRYNFSGRKVSISFWKKIIKLLLIFPALKSIYNRYKLRKLQKEKQEKDEKRDFKAFRECYISKSKLIYNSLEELQETPPQADCYITGSDQVWAQLLSNPENTVFFLDFGTIQTLRISYAASFAMDNYPSELNEKLKIQLQKFKLITVRERTGVEICKRIGFDAFQVLDPTLLLDKCRYLELLNERPKVKPDNKFVYIYSLNISSPDEIRWKELRNYIDRNNLDVKITPASGYIVGKELFGNDVAYEYATIPQWISNINQSELLITPSFHGIVFAIILNKKFIYVPLKGEYSKGNCRVLDLLDKLELSNFILDDKKSIESYINQKIDWKIVSFKLEQLKNNSHLLLAKYLNHENPL